jgi:type II secretory ATPase GspE/PulE/Tfp pilus assembly ATPase PilB-like protein
VICSACREPVSTGADEELSNIGISADTVIYSGRGCEKCADTGFYGRIGIFELLVMDDDIQKLIMKSADSNRIREMAREHGMRTLMEDGVEKIKNGITTIGEVLRVTQEG